MKKEKNIICEVLTCLLGILTIRKGAGGYGNKQCYAKRMIQAVVAAAADIGGNYYD